MTKGARPETIGRPVDAAPAKAADPTAKVRVRFLRDHTHAGRSYKAGEETLLDSHWADSIERFGTGHRLPDPERKE